MKGFDVAAIFLVVVLGVVGVLAIGAWLILHGEPNYGTFVIIAGLLFLGSVRLDT